MTTPTDSGATPSRARGGYCAACGAALSVGAKFCHRCGTPFGQGAPIELATIEDAATPNATAPRKPLSLPVVLPWGVAAVALLVVMAVIAGREGSTAVTSPERSSLTAGEAADAPFAGGARGAPPDIASMTPSERAARLYVRVMQYAEAGKADSVATFAPMVLSAHQMIAQPTEDERYHFGRVAEVVGATEIAKSQADTILNANPRSLLGLVLAARAARAGGNEAAAKAFDKRLLAVVEAELSKGNADYDSHRVEIDRAVSDARRPD